MKSIKWSLLATAALASLVFSVTIQQQNVAASNEDKFVSNHHDHTIISEKHGIRGNEGRVVNDGDEHFNFNDNTNREDREKCNSHSIPANTGEEGDFTCPE
jgi:hypothetical protein